MVMRNISTQCLFIIILLFTENIYGSNWYQNRLNEFNITTHHFRWGYPIEYDLKNDNIRGVIFLTNRQYHVEKLNCITYVGQPTKENAKVIAKVLPELENPYPIYYIAVDTSVQLLDLTEFLEEL